MTLGLGEHGDVFYATENGRTVAMVYYRDYSGIRRRLRANGRSKAEARRRVNDALSRAGRRGGWRLHGSVDAG